MCSDHLNVQARLREFRRAVLAVYGKPERIEGLGFDISEPESRTILSLTWEQLEFPHLSLLLDQGFGIVHTRFPDMHKVCYHPTLGAWLDDGRALRRQWLNARKLIIAKAPPEYVKTVETTLHDIGMIADGDPSED